MHETAGRRITNQGSVPAAPDTPMTTSWRPTFRRSDARHVIESKKGALRRCPCLGTIPPTKGYSQPSGTLTNHPLVGGRHGPRSASRQRSFLAEWGAVAASSPERFHALLRRSTPNLAEIWLSEWRGGGHSVAYFLVGGARPDRPQTSTKHSSKLSIGAVHSAYTIRISDKLQATRLTDGPTDLSFGSSQRIHGRTDHV
jgi:hypothetical protein